MPQLLAQAVSFASRAHQGQFRKDGQTPYIAHPIRVMTICQMLFGCQDETVLTAAVLHDTIEDTVTDYDDLLEHFGDEVANLVVSLTKDSRLPEQKRDDSYYFNLSNASWGARLIKLADCLDNFQDAIDDEIRNKSILKCERTISLVKETDPHFVHAALKLIQDELASSVG